MSRGRWTTPDDPPGELKCFTVYAPSGMECEASLRGAIFMLADARNWEKTGEQTPEAMAQAFTEGLYATLNQWGYCNPMGKHVGEVFILAHNEIPEGCLLCDGEQYEQTAYPALYELIGATYGAADSGFFRVPDLAARVVIGTGQQSGGTLREIADVGGAESRNISPSNLPEHLHGIAISSQNILAGIGNQTAVMRAGGTMNTGNAGFGTALNIMPPFLVLNFVIQAT